MTKPLSWLGVFRLGLVQACLGAMVVIVTSTFNRVMVVEMRLPAFLPGALVALHYFVQMLRPRLGYGSDLGQRRTPWIIGGMAALAAGGVAASLAIGVMQTHGWAGVALAIAAYSVVGLGVGASGTALLTLLAKQVAPTRRGPAATVVWIMMIAGIAITATVAGHALDPFSFHRLALVTATVGGGIVIVTSLAVAGVENRAGAAPAVSQTPATSFGLELTRIWADAKARRFTIFIFISMFAYSAQELILEPFLGAVLGLTPGQSTAMTGLQHGGVMSGMVMVAVLTGVFGKAPWGALRHWTVAGCLLSSVALISLAASPFGGPAWPVRPCLFLLGAANGAFTVSAIGSMMSLANEGGDGREGTRMGLWGAAQAVAFALGGLAGTGASDLGRHFFGRPDTAYAAVFAVEASLFLLAALQARRTFAPDRVIPSTQIIVQRGAAQPQARGV